MRVLVTGGMGFVGTAVTRGLLTAGHQPVAMTSRPDACSPYESVPVVHADVRDADQLGAVVDEVQPEMVCHLAGLTPAQGTSVPRRDFIDVNVTGTANLLAALPRHERVPVVFLSTAAVYGTCDGWAHENQPAAPTGLYGESKLASEELLARYAHAGRGGVVVLRCFTIAGAVCGVGDPDESNIIPAALQVAAGRSNRLTINGDGTTMRDFTHVVDAAAAVILAVRGLRYRPDIRIYNVGGQHVSFLDIVDMVEAVTARPVPVVHRSPDPQPQRFFAATKLITDELRWRARHTLATMIRDAWRATWRQLDGVSTTGLQPRALGYAASDADVTFQEVARDLHPGRADRVWTHWYDPDWAEVFHDDDLYALKATALGDYVDSYLRARWLSDLQLCGAGIVHSVDDPPSTDQLQKLTQRELPDQLLDRALDLLKPRQRDVLMSWLGLHDGQMRTYRQVAQQFELSSSRIAAVVSDSARRIDDRRDDAAVRVILAMVRSRRRFRGPR